jgi:DNA-binding response OmpR family regulator
VGAAQRARPSARLKGVSVLIVEDDFLIFLGVELILSEAGASVAAHCPTLAEARTFIAAQPPDGHFVAVLDIRIGAETSLTLAREMRERAIPFLFYSGQGDWQSVKDQFPEAPLLSKPAHPETLVEVVRSLARRRPLRRS